MGIQLKMETVVIKPLNVLEARKSFSKEIKRNVSVEHMEIPNNKEFSRRAEQAG